MNSSLISKINIFNKLLSEISQIITIFLAVNSIIFTKMNHPMNMGMMLLTQTLMTCILTSTFSRTTWFSYILFLVFLGGMLVLFIYMTSIASNEMFQKSKYLLMITVSSTVMVLMMITTIIDPMAYYYTNTPEMTFNTNMMKSPESMDMLSLYNMPSAMITTFMVIYLFLTLIIVVYITKSHQGPLRPSN
uniref:NADH-ubiquinone oxidoreductase chain 6 n=1 Tax=Ictinogomphus sp. MT-2014 TaxID=1560015 RepID=A0A0A0VAS0_9ODON|nr:NADH dehydrogenase subunit 6 [Ictinogomphus sp. MT-2014]